MNRLADELERQKSEALGPDNKWYCSQYYGYEVTDSETLLCYYIKSGGAAHFRKTHNHAPAASAQHQHAS